MTNRKTITTTMEQETAEWLKTNRTKPSQALDHYPFLTEECKKLREDNRDLKTGIERRDQYITKLMQENQTQKNIIERYRK